MRIRPPRESANPHSFDYAGWLFANNIRAAGYVRDNDGIVVLESGGGLRHSLSQRAQNLFADNPVGALLAALIVGDRSQMSEQQWRVLRRTGTAHLFAISGAHLTIAAGFVAFLFSFLWRRFQILTHIMPAQKIALLVSIPAALVYALRRGNGNQQRYFLRRHNVRENLKPPPQKRKQKCHKSGGNSQMRAGNGKQMRSAGAAQNAPLLFAHLRAVADNQCRQQCADRIIGK